MSHSKERQEKVCLNCNAELTGRFCHECGQENLEPRETVWTLVSHFFHDLTHFDGKFFGSLGYLIRKPGFLSKEYLRGRRASYLNPIRMYVFSSALFFIIFFWMFDPRSWDLGSDNSTKTVTTSSDSTDVKKREELKNAKNLVDSIRIEAYYKALESNRPGDKKKGIGSAKEDDNGFKISYNDDSYETKTQYDSIQKAKPPGKRDGWFTRRINEKFINLNEKYEGNEKLFLKDLLDKFIHTLPYLLFVSLPLYALFLKLLYIRRRKQFLYVDHGIFLIHLYIFTFIMLLILFALYKLKDFTDWGWLNFLQAAFMIYGIIYTVKAMRNFYGQGRGKTIIKFILLNFLAFFSLTFLFVLFFFLAVFRI